LSTGNPSTSPQRGDALADLRERLRLFAAERDWQQFHTPKNLAMSIAIEAAEIMEHFQWLTAAQSLELDAAARREVAHEIADVLLYLIRLADVLDIDLPAAAREKIGLNARKYPVRGGL
jgi:dCTP diphosphatase